MQVLQMNHFGKMLDFAFTLSTTSQYNKSIFFKDWAPLSMLICIELFYIEKE